MIHSCPHCNKACLSSLRKLSLGPLNSVACQHCGRGVAIAWRHGIWLFLVLLLLLFVLRSLNLGPGMIILAGLLMAAILSIVQIRFIPLVKKHD